MATTINSLESFIGIALTTSSSFKLMDLTPLDLSKDKYGYETITRAGDMKHTKNINRKD